MPDIETVRRLRTIYSLHRSTWTRQRHRKVQRDKYLMLADSERILRTSGYAPCRNWCRGLRDGQWSLMYTCRPLTCSNIQLPLGANLQLQYITQRRPSMLYGTRTVY